MGAYITGTLLGTIFNGLMASMLDKTGLFHPYALGMAAGTGSASMMSAALAPVVAAHPEMAGQIEADQRRWHVHVPVRGYPCHQLAVQSSETREKTCQGCEIRGGLYTMEKTSMMETWITRGKVLLFSGVFAAIANYISSSKTGAPVTPLEAVPGLAMMLFCVVVGCILDDTLRKFKINLPSILYISAISMLLSIPGFSPIAEYFCAELNKMNLMSLCTPILAYAGISIGKDLDEFKKQGFHRYLCWFRTDRTGCSDDDRRYLIEYSFSKKSGCNCSRFFYTPVPSKIPILLVGLYFPHRL